MMMEAAAAPAIMWGLVMIVRSIPGIIWAVRCPPDSPAFIFPDRPAVRSIRRRRRDA